MSYVSLGYDLKCDKCGERLESSHSDGRRLSKIVVRNLALRAGWTIKNQPFTSLCPGCAGAYGEEGCCDCRFCRMYRGFVTNRMEEL